jgi:cephalosporin hydroxylase
MTTYPEAFNQDTLLQETFTLLMEEHKPDLILETGTHRADTTEYFLSFGVPVISTEINENFYNISKNKLAHDPNAILLLGDSAQILEDNFHLISDKKIIAFLDSHFLNDQVLERELALFEKLSIKPIIIIHDFYVPGKDLGYDTWDGHRYDYVFYKPYLDKLYGGENTYTYSYNSEAVGCRRGVIITVPYKNEIS